MPRRPPRLTTIGPTLPRVDGLPRRAHSAVNARFEEKAVFDILHRWWSARGGTALRQPDAFSLLLKLALENPDADLPRELRRR